jgi:hypothetical protein
MYVFFLSFPLNRSLKSRADASEIPTASITELEAHEESESEGHEVSSASEERVLETWVTYVVKMEWYSCDPAGRLSS